MTTIGMPISAVATRAMIRPRPHDMGVVTKISHALSQIALQARAMSGLSMPGPSASSVILVEGNLDQVSFSRIGDRRIGVALALGQDVRKKAKTVAVLLCTIRSKLTYHETKRRYSGSHRDDVPTKTTLYIFSLLLLPA
jgi:formate-dependent phosphoribosylglycinamide formyltransferase (GAR transformylase)